MPYTVEHKARTRARIIESARVMFNRHGYERVSIDGIMREAGLTRGGFYNHFDSKEGLYAETVQSYASCNPFAVEGAGGRRRRRARRRGAWWSFTYPTLCSMTSTSTARSTPCPPTWRALAATRAAPTRS